MHPAGLAAAGTPRQRKWRTWPVEEIGAGWGCRGSWRGPCGSEVTGSGSWSFGLCTALGCQVRVGGALGSILLFFRKFLWEKTTLGRILCDVQENGTFIHLQLAISFLLPTLRWPRAVAHAPQDSVQSPS